MALPREPRQKLINLMYLVLTALLALNVSAEVIEAFKTVDTSLVNSNNNIESSNTTIFKSLQQKLTEGTTRQSAEKWSPVANKAKELSDEMMTYLDGLKNQIKDNSGKSTVDGEEIYKLDDLNAASMIFDSQKKEKSWTTS